MRTGQTAIMVVLIGSVVATMGLATVARTVTNVEISNKMVAARIAIQEAEGAIEYGLNPAIPAGDCSRSFFNTDRANVVQCSIGWLGTAQDYEYSLGMVRKGESRTLWLVGHSIDVNETPDVTGSTYQGSVSVAWEGSFEIVEIERTGTGEFQLAKHYYPTSQTVTLDYSGRTVVAIRLKPLSQDTRINYTPHAAFPAQGRVVDATGVVRATNDNRRISATRWYPGLPGIFDYVIFSYSNLSK